MTRRIIVLNMALLGLMVVGCSQSHVPNAIDQANAPKGSGWEPLFNGKDLTGWHARSTDRPMSWTVVDGVLVNESSRDRHGVDLITDRAFSDFEVYCEYNVAEQSNSGLYLRGRYEVQILDNPPDIQPNAANGAFYNTAAPLQNASKPAGQWQSIYARLVGKKACVALNGVGIHCCVELPGPTGGELDNKVDEPGPIMIQGDHGSLKVRNVWIRPLDGKQAVQCPLGCAAGCKCTSCKNCKANCPKAGNCDRAAGCPNAAKCPKAGKDCDSSKCPMAAKGCPKDCTKPCCKKDGKPCGAGGAKPACPNASAVAAPAPCQK